MRRTTARSLALMTAMTIVAAACGGDDDEADGAGPSAASGDTVGEGVTLRANWGGFPENWLPGADFADGYLDVPYETLITYDEDGEIAGELATDWVQTDEGLTLTLREGVVFHDGERFDAEAVKASIEAMQQSDTRIAGPLEVISSVEVVDELTVTLMTSGAAAGLLGSLASPAGIMYSPAAIESGVLAEQPVGTGPWAYDPGASSPGTRLTFTFFPEYWDGRESVGFDTVELYAIEDDNAATGALTTGEIDITDSEVPFLQQFDADEAYDYLEYPAVRNGLHFFDRGPDGMFGDPDVRRAVCHALDTTVVNGLEPDIVPAAQYFAEGEVGHIPGYEGYAHDLDTAQELFADGGSPSISGDYLAAPFNESQVTVYAEQMAELDIDLAVQTVPPPQFFSAWNTGEYPVGTASQDEIHPHDWYLSWYAAEAPNNPAGHESPELAAAADAAIAAGSSDEADELWSEVVQVVEDEALSCGRMVGQEILAWSTERLGNVQPSPTPWVTQTVDYKALRPAGS